MEAYIKEELQKLKNDIFNRKKAEYIGRKIQFSEGLVKGLCEIIKLSRYQLSSSYIYVFVVSCCEYFKTKPEKVSQELLIKNVNSLLIEYIYQHDLADKLKLNKVYSYYGMLIYLNEKEESLLEPTFIQTVVDKRLREKTTKITDRDTLMYLENTVYSVALIRLLTAFERPPSPTTKAAPRISRFCFWKLCNHLSILRKRLWDPVVAGKNSRLELIDKLWCEDFFLTNFLQKEWEIIPLSGRTFDLGFDESKSFVRINIAKVSSHTLEDETEFSTDSSEEYKSESGEDDETESEKEESSDSGWLTDSDDSDNLDKPIFKKYKERHFEHSRVYRSVYLPKKISGLLREGQEASGCHAVLTFVLMAGLNYIYEEVGQILQFLYSERSLITEDLNYFFRGIKKEESLKIDSAFFMISVIAGFDNDFTDIFLDKEVKIPEKDRIFLESKESLSEYEQVEIVSKLENVPIFMNALFSKFYQIVEEYRKEHNIGGGVFYFELISIVVKSECIMFHDKLHNQETREKVKEDLRKWLFSNSDSFSDIRNENLWRCFFYYKIEFEENKNSYKSFIEKADFLDLPEIYGCLIFDRYDFSPFMFFLQRISRFIVRNFIKWQDRKTSMEFIKEKMIEYVNKKGEMGNKEKLHLFCMRIMMTEFYEFKEYRIPDYLDKAQIDGQNQEDQEIYRALKEETDMKEELRKRGDSVWKDEFYDFLLDCFLPQGYEFDD